MAVPVTMTGFFGVGGLEAGEWVIGCRTREHWEETLPLSLDPKAEPSDVRIVLQRQPRLVLTLSHPCESLPRPGKYLERETWLGDAWIVATRGEPGERIEREPLSRERLDRWMPGIKDDVAGRRRTMLFDGPIDQQLADGGWLAFVVGKHVVGAKRVARGDREVVFAFDEKQLARALGGLALRVLDAESGAPVRGARVEFRRSNSREDMPFAIGCPDVQEAGNVVVIPRLAATSLLAAVEVPGRERKVVAIDVPPGDTARVDVRLAAGTAVSGIVVDGAGTGVELELELAPFDGDDRAVRAWSSRPGSSAANGRFYFGDLSPALWVVRSRDPRLAFAPQLVDTREGSVSDVRLEARPGTTVRLVAPAGKWGDASEWLELRDERGFVACEREGWRASWQAQSLLPGRYALRFARADGSVLARDFVVESEPVELVLE
ncbi:MAG: hypothetical protein HZA53_14655 [Planctomycetes bacterium]|nr:hypothetical protein [Planctomycetota bacterium]